VPRWHRSGWLPELEETRWPRLERHRQAHEAAIEALAEAEEPQAHAEAMLEVCTVVEGAFADLREHFGEGEAAISAARASVTPTAPAPDRGGVDFEKEIEARGKQARRETEERIANRPKLLAVRRDWEALSALLNGVLDAGEVLLDAEVLPVVLAQVAETRAGLEPVAEATGEAEAGEPGAVDETTDPDAAKVPEAAAA
jgi:hypothetical protein